MRRRLTACALAAALLALAAAAVARAQEEAAEREGECECGAGSRGFYPCNSYWAADAVFVGVAAEVGPVKWSADGKTFTTRGRVTRFEVREAFRGVSSGAAEVVDRGTIFDYRFNVGQEYFVYAKRDAKTGKLYVCTCSQTNLLGMPTEDDLAFARAVAQGELTPGIAGKVLRLGRAGGAAAFTESVGVEGVGVVAEGGGRTFEAVTDAEGLFRMYGVPAGEYFVRAKLPAELERALPGKNRHRVKVVEGSCYVTTFTVPVLATVKGRAVESDGGPAATKVSLVPVGEDGAEIRPAEGKVEAETDAEGRYKFGHVAPGRYLVAVNPRGQPASDDAPYPRTYLPGVRDKSDAQVITVRGGEEVEANEFRLPPPLRRETVEGVARWPDGRPAAGAVVVLEFTEREWTEEFDADAEGRFSLDIYEGFKYLVTAEVRAKRSARHSRTAMVSLGSSSEPLTLTISRPGYYVPRYARRRASN